VEEYLNTAYEPDMEYVDGVLVEINVRDLQHGLILSNVIFALMQKYPSVTVLPGVTHQRLLKLATAFRTSQSYCAWGPGALSLNHLLSPSKFSLKKTASRG
jgi:hypothetical protein